MEDNQINSIIIGVISSLIASIIFYLAVPFLKKKIKQLIAKIERTNKKYRDEIIRKSARRDDNHFTDLGGIIIMMFVLVIGIAMAVGEKVDLSTKFLVGLTEKVFTFSSMMFFFFYLFFRFVKRESVIDKINSFEYNMAVLGGEIPYEEVASLKSEWALMKNNEDYEKIMNKIKELKKEKFKNTVPNNAQNGNTP